MTTLDNRFRLTIRVRLTLIYGGLFLAGGVILLALTYVLLKNNLSMPAPGPETNTFRAPAGQPIEQGQLPDAPPGEVFTKQQFGAALVKERGAFEQKALRSLLTQGGIALGLVAFAALALGWLIADRALRPVHQITETARRVARSHDLTERIAYAGPHDDVKEMADTFDTMLGRLARAFDSQRRFVANASHELRTPLAINRTLVDVAVRRPDATEDVKRLGDSLLIVNGRHERLIDGLLTLAGSENPVVDMSPLDLADVAGHVLDQAGTEAAACGVGTARDTRRAPTAGDPVLIERLVQNLVENAIRHNHGDGDLTVATRSHSDVAELVVTNTGPVVPPYEVETIFEPFRRLGTDRVHSERGSGLGLSIVRATATAHGGTVTATPRPGGGLTVTVHLPIRDRASRPEPADPRQPAEVGDRSGPPPNW